MSKFCDAIHCRAFMRAGRLICQPCGFDKEVPESLQRDAPDCQRRGSIIRGCRFEPRYDLGQPCATKVQSPFAGQSSKIIEASKPKTYVRDVCVTCGRTIEREAKP